VRRAAPEVVTGVLLLERMVISIHSILGEEASRGDLVESYRCLLNPSLSSCSRRLPMSLPTECVEVDLLSVVLWLNIFLIPSQGVIKHRTF